ncbi:DUF3231 family protein [Ornithinibacillus halophilus]|uniref:Uncharacterized protein n=1 Tax=Ornithinibacillus halophilus TaxID=930117 RepID=A0A1M5LHI5_9BACI|nr:DUF3231 family protein [Ornithinibacillus halophilus]SHG64139.1 Protein of unknown function [Ornithinibacillus halophilus]
MDTKETLPLTAPEISSLWTQYIFDSMSVCFFRYAIEHIEDKDILILYQDSLYLSEKHMKKIKGFLKKEKYPIPKGFTEEDVNVKAPRLFQDPFYLFYLYIMALQGLTSYGVSVSTSIRGDVRKYFKDCNTEAMNLYDKTIETMLIKGLFSRPPVLTPPDSIDFVTHQSFLTGWFGERRPLTGQEISDITFNLNKMHMHVVLKLGFSQVSKSERLRKYINRGMKISSKHIREFEDIFHEEKLNVPISWQANVTDSTEAPFSDKLMMYQVQLSTQIAIAFYGAALSVSGRRDLALKYVYLTTELARYVEDGANLMIDKGWLEQPPLAADRRKLIKANKGK